MRVNIEASALAEGRFHKLAQDYFDGSRVETIGALVLFWFESQERELVKGSRSEIVKTLPYWSTEDNDSFFDALVKHDYIKIIDGDLYEISGNARHVEKLQHLKSVRSDAAKKANKVRWNRKSSQMNRKSSQAVANLPRNSNQINAVQLNANQNKETTIAEAGVPPVAAFPTVTLALFETWANTYGDREWITTEIKKAECWIKANTARAPKSNFNRFLNNWLSRAWESHRKLKVVPIQPRSTNPQMGLPPEIREIDQWPETNPELVRTLREKMQIKKPDGVA